MKSGSKIGYSLYDISKGSPSVADNNSVYTFLYPCNSTFDCSPYIISLPKGRYKFEAWGAGSGTDCFYNTFALGAYVSGTISLPSFRQFFVFLGGKGGDADTKGKRVAGGFNGGGCGGEYGSGGGGGTDIRIDQSLSSRFLIAGGAGGGERVSTGHGGNISGLQGQYQMCGASNFVLTAGSEPGNQTSGGRGGSINTLNALSGSFGKGGDGYTGGDGGGGGGGGYYGGGGTPYVCSASGGSSFISGHSGCISVLNDGNNTPSSSSIHYSKLMFTNTEMITGNNQMPLYQSNDASGNGNHGSGAFRITILSISQCSRKQILYHHIHHLFHVLFYSFSFLFFSQ